MARNIFDISTSQLISKPQLFVLGSFPSLCWRPLFSFVIILLLFPVLYVVHIFVVPDS